MDVFVFIENSWTYNRYVVLHIYPSSMYVKMTSPMKKKRNKYIYIIRIN